MITKGLLAVVAVMFVMIVWGKFQILTLEKELQTAVVKQEAAETSLHTAQQEKALADIQLAQFEAKMVEIEKERSEAVAQVNKMRDTFQDHDFAKLLTKKPGLIQNLMIKKTQEVFDEIEALTAN